MQLTNILDSSILGLFSSGQRALGTIEINLQENKITLQSGLDCQDTDATKCSAVMELAGSFSLDTICELEYGPSRSYLTCNGTDRVELDEVVALQDAATTVRIVQIAGAQQYQLNCPGKINGL